MRSYLFISAKPGAQDGVIEQLLLHEGVVIDLRRLPEDICCGDYDLLATIETDNPTRFQRFIEEQVNNIPDIEDIYSLANQQDHGIGA